MDETDISMPSVQRRSYGAAAAQKIHMITTILQKKILNNSY